MLCTEFRLHRRHVDEDDLVADATNKNPRKSSESTKRERNVVVTWWGMTWSCRVKRPKRPQSPMKVNLSPSNKRSFSSWTYCLLTSQNTLVSIIKVVVTHSRLCRILPHLPFCATGCQFGSQYHKKQKCFMYCIFCTGACMFKSACKCVLQPMCGRPCVCTLCVMLPCMHVCTFWCW